MGKIGVFIRDLASSTVEGLRRLASSRLNRWVIFGLLAAAFITPLALPAANAWVYSTLAATALFAVGRSVFHALMRPGGASPAYVENNAAPAAAVATGDNSQKQQREQIAKAAGTGEKTGDDLTDALVDRLRAMKINVSTNWEAAKLLIDTFPDKFAALKNDKENIRGFVWEGRIFINPGKATAEVAIHEYTHLWAEALRQQNVNEWDNIVTLLKEQKDLWESVKTTYPHLTTDNEIADEVLAQYSGRRGYQRLQEHCKEGKSPEDVFTSLLAALKTFWASVSRVFKFGRDDYQSIDDIADLSLYSFLKGENPLRSIDPNKISLSDHIPLGYVEQIQTCKVVPLAVTRNQSKDTTNITAFIVERLKDPSPRAAFSTEQQDCLLAIMEEHETASDKIAAVMPYWRAALDTKEAKSVDDEWKKDAVNELYDLAYGIRRAPNNGMKLN